MTQYNSFVLNSFKYFRESFVYVANGQSVERQGIEVEETPCNNGTSRGRRKSNSEGEWVAFILEIRASDEQHVFARVCWMYWPEELPEGTMDGDIYPGGRQSYHGRNELIASNHMDIINVTSVTSPADVQHWNQKDDEDVQEALYWRQALDCRTKQLSSVVRLCTCRQPANPDKTLIGCSNRKCAKWLHEDCLQKDALLQAYRRLAEDESHPDEGSPAGDGIPVSEGGMEKGKMLLEDGRQGSFNQWKCSAATDRSSEAEPRNNGRAPEEQLAPIATLTTPNDIVTASKALLPTSVKGLSGDLESVKANTTRNEEPLEAKILIDADPPRIEIKVLGKEWTEPLRCILCGSTIM
ncbi:EBS-BAH-PHD domain-containing protein [Colletotrichum incanum]|nr:EBS-BAH-PHD domain-containing protein [Colletotrichum incanum]